jgi:TRAP-type uncharacterized transport system substrate-binding protein
MTSRILRWAADRRIPLICGIVFVIIGLSAAVALHTETQIPTLRIGSGPNRSGSVATYLRERAAQNGLSLELMTSAGSEDSLHQLQSGQLDVVIINNGVVVPDHDNITVLGAIQPAAAHVLVRRDSVKAGTLAEIVRGKRVNMGERGSTEWLLARDLLSFARIKLPSESSSGDITPTEYGKAYLLGKARAIQKADGAAKEALIAELPDCVIVVAAMPSTIVQSLVETADYRIVPLLAARAFLLSKLEEEKSTTTILDRQYLERTPIPANCYFATRGYPETETETIGMRSIIVARKDVPAQAIKLLMKTIFEGNFAHLIQPKSPRDVPTPYAIHPAAIAYLDRDKPLAIQEAAEWISKGFSLLGVFSAGALSLYGFLRKRKVRKPSDYFAAIRKVELLAQGVEVEPNTPIQPKELAVYLDDRLAKVRHDLIEDICEGRMKNDQVIANILTLLKDAQRNLSVSEGKASDLAAPSCSGRSATKAA